MPTGEGNPETSAAFTVAPEVVYLPIVPGLLTTNKSEPELAMYPNPPPLNPETNEAFTVAPEVVYLPIVPVSVFTTNKSEPDTVMPAGPLNPETNEAFTVAPEVVYLPIVPVAKFVTNRSEPEMAMPLNNPGISEAFTSAPDVVYSAIAPEVPKALEVVTKSSAWAALLESNPSKMTNRPSNPHLYSNFIVLFLQLTGCRSIQRTHQDTH
jgi:hypothetical protein